MASAATFAEDLVVFDVGYRMGDRERTLPEECEAAYEAWCSARGITSASADSSRVLIGLSGGIDSSLTAAIAVEAWAART